MAFDENPELVGEFKNAATAVTKLFKLASSNQQAAYQQGYLDALRHLLDQLEADEDTNVQQWAVHQLTGITQNNSEVYPHHEEAHVGDKRPYHHIAKKRHRNDFSTDNSDTMNL